jgi:hypothetical protein
MIQNSQPGDSTCWRAPFGAADTEPHIAIEPRGGEPHGAERVKHVDILGRNWVM